MQQIGPVLADPLLQIGDAAGQLSPLVLQSGNDMRFGHNPYPLEKMGLCSSCQRYLASRSWWRLIHKTDKVDFDPRITGLRQRLVNLEDCCKVLRDQAAVQTTLSLII